MSRSEHLVRLVLGPCRRGIRPFVYAIDCTIQHSFAIGFPIEDIQVTKVIYCEVATLMGIKESTAARQIERIANDCWDRGNREQLDRIFGGSLPVCPTPREMLFYFAAFSYYGRPFNQIIDDGLALLF